jgi:hypothetical protein
MSELYQLIYVSSATSEYDAEAIRSILASSVRHNTENGITGLLLYSHGSIMQVLEGTKEAIAETMKRIVADTRHFSVIEMLYDPIPERDFGTWSMGFHEVTVADADALPGYAPFFEHGFDAAVIGAKPGMALDILRSFADKSR